MSQEDLQKLQRDIVEASAFIRPLKTEMSRIVAGQSELIDRLIAAMLADTFCWKVFRDSPRLSRSKPLRRVWTASLHEFSSRPTCCRPT